MRDRLIEILKRFCTDDCKITHQCGYCDFGDLTVCPSAVADHLLKNGVVVLPCKVGDKVYSCIGREYYVRRIIIKDGMPTTFLLESGLYGQLCVTESDFGSLAYLTKEESEKALAERSGE